MRRFALLSNVVYALLLVVLAMVPRLPSISGLNATDSLAHASAYGFQAGLLFWLFHVFSAGNGALWAVLGASGFGALTEVLQLLSPVRHFELSDMVADFMGAMIVVAFLVGLAFLRTRWVE